MPKLIVKRDHEDEVEEKEDKEKVKGPIENAWEMKIPPFQKGAMKHHLQEETRFEIAFPKYREKYIKECWPVVKKLFDEHGIKADLNLLEGTMSVATTRKTWDPFIIIKSRDVIKLLGRSVPFEHAVKVLKDDITCEIVKIKNMVRNRERFIKRRQRLIGSNGTALKALELLTNCYVLVQGCTVSVIGPHRGVLEVVNVVKKTMKNVHPINLLKVLMVKRTLAKDPEKKNEDWSRYIPTHVNTNVQRKKPKKIRQKKPYTPFPPEMVESKEDQQMESGRYFIEKEEKSKYKGKKTSEEQKKKSSEKRKEKREKAFEAPEEPKFTSHAVSSSSSGFDVNLKQLKKKLKTK
ncbi:UNVERIFIED_CONTAM: hypothetical protein RMT77_001575 [Armadillidium vulgare]|nr:KRR1 small subunit processome component-like protein [Armadillidium vulgare]